MPRLSAPLASPCQPRATAVLTASWRDEVLLPLSLWSFAPICTTVLSAGRRRIQYDDGSKRTSLWLSGHGGTNRMLSREWVCIHNIIDQTNEVLSPHTTGQQDGTVPHRDRPAHIP
eukprot:767808-Prymnesium_polylepis.1